MAKNRIIMGGYVYNYNIYINYIKKVLDKKILGPLKYMSFDRLNLGPVRNDVSCIWDLASHDLSTCYYLLRKNNPIDRYVFYYIHYPYKVDKYKLLSVNEPIY